MIGTGILAYGSLITDPGAELAPLIARRIETMTPFPVEYARYSRTRGMAPTVVPHSSGRPVKAMILVLEQGVPLTAAINVLWRRELRKVGPSRAYRASTNSSAVLVLDKPEFCGLEHVLYTDFNSDGKIDQPYPPALAEAAVASVSRAPHGRDGISYLIDLVRAGVETTLTADYIRYILSLTRSASLEEALDSLRRST